MKKSGLVAASMAAASAKAYSVSSSSTKSNIPHEDVGVSSKKGDKSGSQTSTTSSDKFAPKFDGLRFIETLITAHR